MVGVHINSGTVKIPARCTKCLRQGCSLERVGVFILPVACRTKMQYPAHLVPVWHLGQVGQLQTTIRKRHFSANASTG